MQNGNFQKIDMSSWPRRELYNFFSSVSDPFFSVTFRVDVTRLYDFAKQNGLSFYRSLVFLVTKAINSVEAFRVAVINGELVLLDERRPSFTDMKKGSEVFHIVTMSAGDDLFAFCRDSKAKSDAQQSFIDLSAEGSDLLFISSLPWLDVTAVTNERDFDPDDAIPRVTWGKFTECGGRKTLGMSLELNHRFIDGIHIGAFDSALRDLIEKL